MAKMSSDVKQLTDALLRLIPDAPKGPTPESKAMKAKQLALKKATFKSKRFAYYIVGREGAYQLGKSYNAGEVIKVPLEAPYHGLPSKTFLAATPESIATAENEARLAKAEEDARAIPAADDDALDADELAADRLASSEAEADEEPEEPETEEPPAEEPEVLPAPPPKPRGAKKPSKPAPKKGTAGKRATRRASDTDVA